MGKGQKAIQQTATTRSAEQYAAGNDAAKRLVDSPELSALKDRVHTRRAAIDAGDLRGAKDFVGNSANTAAREQDRELKANLTKTGVAGLASNYADPTAVALADQANKDEFARDSAAQNEADAKDYIGQTENMESGIINTETGRDTAIMGNAWGNANSNLNTAAQVAAARSSILPSVLGSVIQGTAGVVEGSNWFQKK